MRLPRGIGTTVVAALLATLAVAVPAHAAFPGENGKIAFVHFTGFEDGADIYSVNPDGSGITNLTNTPGESETDPAWSPDGRYLAFVRNSDIYVIRADGSVLTRFTAPDPLGPGLDWSPDGGRLVFEHAYSLATIKLDGTNFQTIGPSGGYRPTWSPDGARIAFQIYDGPSGTDIHTIKPDGAGEQVVTNAPGEDAYPDWSPDGHRIAFLRDQSLLYTVRPDGTDLTPIPGSERDRGGHAWSPDGQKLAVGRFVPGTQFDVYATDSAGGNATPVFSDPTSDYQPDWQPAPPAPQPGYARPRGATPFRVSLVPAYLPCDAPNNSHGAPIDQPSCSSPQTESPYLTVGTPDSNGAPAKFIGSVRFDVVPGNSATLDDEADVALSVDLSDVRCKSAAAFCDGGALSDYKGELQGAVLMRITDRFNSPAFDDPATAVEVVPFYWTVPCFTTPDPTVGSTCSLHTTLDALRPGIVVERKRAIWQLGRVEVLDGGNDGRAITDENSRFAAQGVFIP
jgi:WD40-like Beta Propeller Repeat